MYHCRVESLDQSMQSIIFNHLESSQQHMQSIRGTNRSGQWSDLPTELLSAIGKRLDTRIELLRFRSVCKSWRSSIPPLRKIFPLLPLYLPYPIISTDFYEKNRCYFTLSQSTVYCLKPIQDNPLAPSSSSSSLSTSNAWLVKVEEWKPGKMCILNPLSEHRIKYSPDMFPKQLNLSNFRIVELTKAYVLRYISVHFIHRVEKVVFHPNVAWTSMEECAVLVLHNGGNIALCKYGEEIWTHFDRKKYSFITDIIVYKGQFHVVDICGTLSVIESASEIRRVSAYVKSEGRRKHLVESCGDLYLVDRYLDTTWYHFECMEGLYLRDKCYDMTVGFKVYKLDQEMKEWVEVKTLDGQVLFLGNDCSFFVYAKDFPGCEEDCIYFTERNFFMQCEDRTDDALRGLQYGNNIGLFSLKDHRFGWLASFPCYAQSFWPPPTWLKWNLSPTGG